MHQTTPDRVTIVIPTYNRAHILIKTLQGYAGQEGRDRILEVLVVDDGSRDDTRAVVAECDRQFGMPLRYLYQENSGLAAARNHAIREARGELILFGDDDIVPSRRMVAEHVEWHRSYPHPNVGVLGHVAWAKEVHPTAFMEWEGLYGPQFHFGRFEAGAELDYSQSYFCNTSVKTSYLTKQALFNESFRAYGWEDIEFSYRLYKSGWRLRYNPNAVGYHYKHETFDQTLRRIEKLWLEAWPVFLKTEAGRHSFELWSSQRMQSCNLSKNASGNLVDRVKAAAVPLLKPLMDWRLRLPARIYDFVWYHHCNPIMDAAFTQPKPVETRSDVKA